MITHRRVAVAVWLATGLLVALVGTSVVLAHGGETHQSSDLQTCEHRRSILTATMKRMTERAQKHFTLFETTTNLVQHFYIDQGKMSSNYDHHSKELHKRHQAVKNLLESLKTKSASFSCAKDPKMSLQEFGAEHRKAYVELAGYKTALKNLIVEIKTIQEAQ